MNTPSPDPVAPPELLPVEVIAQVLVDHQRAQSTNSKMVHCECPWFATIEAETGKKLHATHQARAIQDAHRNHIYEATGVWPYDQVKTP